MLESIVLVIFYGVPSLLVPAEIRELEGAFLSSYNTEASSNLPNENCLSAGGFRNITTVSLVTNLTELQQQPQYQNNNTLEFLLQFRVTVLCRRCLHNSSIFAVPSFETFDAFDDNFRSDNNQDDNIEDNNNNNTNNNNTDDDFDINYDDDDVYNSSDYMDDFETTNNIFSEGNRNNKGSEEGKVSSFAQNAASSCGCLPLPMTVFLAQFELEFQILRSRRVISSLQRVVDVVEARPVDCAPTTTTFTSSVLVDVSHSDPNLFTDPQVLNQMTDAFVTTYNNINGINIDRTCDPFFRRAITATVRIGDLNPAFTQSTEQVFDDDDDIFFFVPSFTTLLFWITAECRGCNASDTMLFQSESSVAEVRRLADQWNDEGYGRKRTLNQQPEECICPVEAEVRARTEFEFLDAYNITLGLSLDDLVSIDDVIEYVTVPCDPVPTNFNTTVDVDLDGNPEVLRSTNGTARVATEFLSVYNNIAQRFCDPFFRFASSVAASIVGPTTPGSRLLQDNNFTLPPGPPNTTFRFRVRLAVTGVCRGCRRDSSIFDDGFRRRRMLDLPNDPMDRIRKHRWLQGDDCYCATINVVDGAPTERDFFIAYDRDIQGLLSNGAIEGLTSVTGLEEESNGAVNTSPPMQMECQTDSDCVNQEEGDLCVFNECLFDGNPRFTLTWTGDDDYDLAVTSPSGRLVFWGSVFDSVARGVFDTGFVQDVQGNHVESIFYSTSRPAPAGVYNASVTQFEQRGAPDNWLLQIYVGNVVRQSINGAGTLDSVAYLFSDGVPPAACSIGNDGAQCCSNDDCTNGMLGDLCVNRQCITDGELRLTLTYFGDDVLIIFAEARIDFELVEVGIFEPDKNEFQSGFHTVNIYSPPNVPLPVGEYFFYVDLIAQNGVALDEWRVEFIVNGKVQSVETGNGASNYFSTLLVPDVAGLTTGLTGSCTVDANLIECCSDADCLTTDICSYFKCIPRGTPQFILSWFGYDDLDILVRTPGGTDIFWANPEDPISPIVLRDDPNASAITHVETVYAPLGTVAPVGQYSYGVNVWDQVDDPDSWNLTVTVDGIIMAFHQGTGQSNLFVLDYGSSADIIPSMAPSMSLVPSQAPSRRGFSICFSGSNMVHVEGKGPIVLSDLKIGDSVLVGPGRFETVYGFGHYHKTLEGEYLQIHTERGGEPLEISRQHLVFVKGYDSSVPAAWVRVGDEVQLGSTGEWTAVIRIVPVGRLGLYAPFTPSGVIVVSDVVVSSYIGLQDGAKLRIKSWETPLSYQWLGHLFETPHRLICLGAFTCKKETYTPTGESHWVAGPFRIWMWVMDGPHPILLFVAVLLWIPLVLLYAGLMGLEHVGCRVVMALLAIVAFACRRRKI